MGRVRSTGCRDRLIWVRLTFNLLSVDLILRLLNNPRVGRDGQGPPNKVGQSCRWTPLHELPFHHFILLSESEDLILILPLGLIVPSLHLVHLFLQGHQERHLFSIRHLFVHHASG